MRTNSTEGVNRLVKLKDRSEIMSILLNKSCTYYNRIKKIIGFPLNIITSGLVIVNSYFKDNDKNLREINIALNASNILLMALLNNLKITEKIENFKNKSFDFFELSHQIDSDLLINSVDSNKVISFQEKYDAIMKNLLTEDIPEHIKESVKNEYEDRHLPLILGKMSPNNSIDDNINC